MPQTLFVKGKGPLEFEKTWINNAIHIGRIPGGGYMHLGGQPVKTEKELREVIPDGPELVDALNWFKNRDKPKLDEKPKRQIIIMGDGFSFADAPIQSIQEIMNNTIPGAMQDLVLAWWGKKLDEKNKAERREISRTSRAVGQIRQELQEKKAEEEPKSYSGFNK